MNIGMLVFCVSWPSCWKEGPPVSCKAYEGPCGASFGSFWACRLYAPCNKPNAPCLLYALHQCKFELEIEAQCAAPVMCAALVAQCVTLFARDFWRPYWCQNWVWDSALEILLSLFSNPTIIFHFVVHFPCQKSNLPRLVKMCKMRLPKGRVLLKSTFEGLPQLKIELMIVHWKDICV